MAIASRASSGSSTTRSPAPRRISRTSQDVAGVGQLDDDGAVGQLLDHGALLAQPARPLRRDPDAGDVGGRHLAVGHPALDAGQLLDLGARLEGLLGERRLLDPVELEVANAVFGQVVALDVPALVAVLQPVGLDRAFGELVLVLLVVLELEDAAGADRLVDRRARPRRRRRYRGDLQPLLGGIVAERADDLGAGGLQAALRQVVAEEVDRRDQRLGLERQQPRRAGEVVAVGLGVDLDLVALDFGVEDVGAAAEVDDVEQVDVLLQLLVGEFEPLAQTRRRRAAPSPLADSISRPARVTRRAKRSGRIAASPRPLERVRRGASRSGRSTISAGSKPLSWRSWSRPRRLSASARSSSGASTSAFWRQRSTQAISSRGEA